MTYQHLPTPLELIGPDALGPYRLPDGTLDVDALELGRPTPGLPDEPIVDRSSSHERGEVLDVDERPVAEFVPRPGPTLGELAEWRDSSLERSLAQRRRSARDANLAVALTLGVMLGLLAARWIGLL